MWLHCFNCRFICYAEWIPDPSVFSTPSTEFSSKKICNRCHTPYKIILSDIRIPRYDTESWNSVFSEVRSKPYKLMVQIVMRFYEALFAEVGNKDGIGKDGKIYKYGEGHFQSLINHIRALSQNPTLYAGHTFDAQQLEKIDTESGRTLLHMILRRHTHDLPPSFYATLATLLQKYDGKLDINYKCREWGNTPFGTALTLLDPRLLITLIENSPSPPDFRIANKQHQTPLHRFFSNITFNMRYKEEEILRLIQCVKVIAEYLTNHMTAAEISILTKIKDMTQFTIGAVCKNAIARFRSKGSELSRVQDEIEKFYNFWVTYEKKAKNNNTKKLRTEKPSIIYERNIGEIMQLVDEFYY
ncbi:18551_t:CDS:2 [Acaulospora morrowiae]|uniref:18551_t:CDS:1 n=1 Tax=Acaulospora morrowiae TaxID=94023 RepID=A0A9N9BA96_9GLOM|nr:18551_t:CDS:2 [Acaulospora morrowiae]